MTTVSVQADPLSITVYVADQSNEKRIEAFKGATDIAMRRLTGQQVPNQPEHSRIRDFASSYIKGFRYSTKGNADIEAIRIPGVRKLLLKVDFNVDKLRKALQSGGAGSVVARMPKILFWVAETARGKRQIINAQQRSTTSIVLKQYTNARGIDMVLPEYNARERLMVSSADIAGGFDSNIISASSAYIVDSVVVLSLEQLPNSTWRGAWTAIGDNARSKWTVSGRNRNEAISKGMSELKALLARLSGIQAPSTANEVDLRVEVQNVRSLNDYAQVSHYLNSLSSVKLLVPVNIKPDRVAFTLQLQADQGIFQRQVVQNNVLQLVLNDQSIADTVSNNVADLTFFYQSR